MFPPSRKIKESIPYPTVYTFKEKHQIAPKYNDYLNKTKSHGYGRQGRPDEKISIISINFPLLTSLNHTTQSYRGYLKSRSLMKRMSMVKSKNTQFEKIPISEAGHKFYNDLLSHKNKVLIKPGNNSSLVKRVLLSRDDWVDIPSKKADYYQMKWLPFSNGFKFDNLSSEFPQIINHFEYHKEITTKHLLLKNMKLYCEQNKENVFLSIPITFFVELSEDRTNLGAESVLRPFILLYNLLSNKKDKVFDTVYKSTEIYKMPQSHFVGRNLWILKPTSLNRGQGIEVFDDLTSLKHILLDNFFKDPRRNTESFVIQKYIENPFLIYDRKFDIRCWVLVSHTYDCYFFKEGYIRTSSSKFALKKSSLQDKFIHLTNNAIQKDSTSYSTFEEGNQLSFKDFAQYIRKLKPDSTIDFFANILPEMKALAWKSLQSVRKKINQKNRKYCFEIFGYDFLIDNDMNPWLIEVNTNPCLEESSSLLKTLIPRMLNDAFSIVVDPLFSFTKSCSSIKYHVYGYEDTVNLWEKLGNIKEHCVFIKRNLLPCQLYCIDDEISLKKYKLL